MPYPFLLKRPRVKKACANWLHSKSLVHYGSPTSSCSFLPISVLCFSLRITEKMTHWGPKCQIVPPQSIPAQFGEFTVRHTVLLLNVCPSFFCYFSICKSFCFALKQTEIKTTNKSFVYCVYKVELKNVVIMGSFSKQEFKAAPLDIGTCLTLGGTLRHLDALWFNTFIALHPKMDV